MLSRQMEGIVCASSAVCSLDSLRCVVIFCLVDSVLLMMNNTVGYTRSGGCNAS